MDRLGTYRLRKRLAVGGMGEVYLGEKIGPEGFVKPVVLKCVLPQLASDRAFVKLFEDEARLSARLNHPNIAQVYDFGMVDSTYYIAMEYVPGYTVDDIRRKLRSIHQFLPLEHVACIASQVCQGLHYAHMLTDGEGVPLGLVHRDVSPHNLIVSVDGGVKIVDFGIAKARAGLTRVQAKGAVGKFGYMSPEQARGDQVDGRSDVFSLGICLWELLTNERLHDANLDRAPAYSPTRPVRSVEAIRAEMPRQFLQILETALSIQPEDRFQTAQDMHLALERFQAARTHYAGQAALAQYIKDLVDGRVEHPEQPNTGELVRPAIDPVRRPATQRPSRSSMDEAQRYEEVFGVTVSSKRPRPTMRAVPKSWEVQPPPAQRTGDLSARSEPPPAEPILLGAESRSGRPVPAPPGPNGPQVGGAPRLLDLAGSGEGSIELDLASQRPPSRVSSRPLPPPPVAEPSGSLRTILMLLLLASLVGGAFVYRDSLVPLVTDMVGGSNEGDGTPTMTSAYRIESTPNGATVYVDGEKQQGVTPLSVNLMPGIEHRILVRRPGRATIERRVTADVHEAPAALRFTLEPSAILNVNTVPPGATVTIDGREADGMVTPLKLTDVPAGRPFRIRVEVKGLPPKERTVTVAKGKIRSLTFEF